MKKNIYIFTSKSYQPNLYVNVLGNCVEEFGLESIEDVYLLKIIDNFENSGNSLTPADELKLIRANVVTQLKALSSKKFYPWDKDGEKFDEESVVENIDIKEKHHVVYQLLYDKILEDEIRYKAIRQENLETTLKRIIANPSYEFIFDLTGVPKKDFLRISLILLSKECSIYIFEVLRRFTQDENDMIHNLLNIKDQSVDEPPFIHHHLNPNGYSVVRVSSENRLEMMKRKWKTEIARDKTKQVLGDVTEYLEKLADMDIDLQKEILSLSRRNHEINHKYQNNILSKSDYDIEVNKINDALIDVIYKIE